MADYTVTLTDAQDAVLTNHIEVNDASDVSELLQTTIDALCVQVEKSEKERSWEGLSEDAKDVALTAGMAEDAKVVEVEKSA